VDFWNLPSILVRPILEILLYSSEQEPMLGHRKEHANTELIETLPDHI
jgi:hypothetical protein